MHWVLVGFTLGGAISMMVWRYWRSHEPFDPVRFSAALAATAAAIGVTEGLASGDNITWTDTGLVSLCITAFLEGWGAVYGTREIINLIKGKR